MCEPSVRARDTKPPSPSPSSIGLWGTTSSGRPLAPSPLPLTVAASIGGDDDDDAWALTARAADADADAAATSSSRRRHPPPRPLRRRMVALPVARAGVWVSGLAVMLLDRATWCHEMLNKRSFNEVASARLPSSRVRGSTARVALVPSTPHLYSQLYALKMFKKNTGREESVSARAEARHMRASCCSQNGRARARDGHGPPWRPKQAQAGPMIDSRPSPWSFRAMFCAQ